MEYHSESGTELETGDYTLSSPDQKDTILDVRFPMPYTFPKPYLTLQEAIDNASESKQNPNMEEDCYDSDPLLLISHTYPLPDSCLP